MWVLGSELWPSCLHRKCSEVLSHLSSPKNNLVYIKERVYNYCWWGSGEEKEGAGKTEEKEAEEGGGGGRERD